MMYGATPIKLNSLAGTATLARGGRCIVVACHAINTLAATSYTQLFDAALATDVTPGTTLPLWVVKSTASDPSAGDGLPTLGLVFTLGVVACSTTTDTGATGAAQHVRIGII